MARGGEGYGGRSSPWWCDGEQFFEALQAAGGRPVRDLIAALDGCSGAKAGQIAAAFKNTPCKALSRDQAVQLLQAARAKAKPVQPKRLGAVGALSTLPSYYAIERGTFMTGARAPHAEIPCVVEAWTYIEPGAPVQPSVRVFVNRTPITGSVYATLEKAKLSFYGCGLSHEIDAKRGEIDLVVNVTTPYCPITTDGKEPDLRPFDELIEAAVQRAMNKARRAVVRSSDDGERLTQKRIILDHLEEGIAKASGDGAYRFNQRQLFYVLRPFVLEALGVAPTWKNFCDILTNYEAENGDIAGMFRDVRGTLYHPHLGQDIPLGTLAVEQYERPNWIFNKALFIEKEGFFEALKAAQWPERHDCALMTGKGYASRAVRDLVDFLGDSDEPLTVFAAHDADAYGTMIYQTLQEATKARPRRRVEIVNLGLVLLSHEAAHPEVGRGHRKRLAVQHMRPGDVLRRE